MYTQVQVNWKRCNRVGVISELRLLFSVCDQCPGEDEHVQNEVHALLICQDHRVCELRKLFSFLFTPFFEDFSAASGWYSFNLKKTLGRCLIPSQNTESN